MGLGQVRGPSCETGTLLHHKFCYFHKQWRQKRLVINSNLQRERGQVTLPVLEDADSIQMGLVEVMRLLVTQQIDHKTAGLLLYALQTASANLKRTSFEPEQPTRVVIDRGCVGRRPIGATAWSTVEGREYDDADGSTDGGVDLWGYGVGREDGHLRRPRGRSPLIAKCAMSGAPRR
jgi:hypothetical protein